MVIAPNLKYELLSGSSKLRQALSNPQKILLVQGVSLSLKRNVLGPFVFIVNSKLHYISISIACNVLLIGKAYFLFQSFIFCAAFARNIKIYTWNLNLKYPKNFVLTYSACQLV